MQFTSYDFMIFFPIVLILYFVVPAKLRQLWLLLASLVFYMSWNVTYVILMLISIAVTYGCGLLLSSEDIKRRKLTLIVGLIINFSILFFFKYFDFALDTINGISGLAGIKPIRASFNVLLPVGISFYTFQAVGYMIDVYRHDIKPERSFIRYALFVSFFPQLVAGPIERSKNMLGQLEKLSNKKIFNFNDFKSGAILMAWGYFLKLVIADRVSILADEIFDRYYAYGCLILILGAVSFSLQIYCDFMSYSLIAMGAARMLGVKLMDNFDTPYLALSIKDFWHRWHISLSTWFRDYLYIPLGGSRCSRIKKYRNIMLTFLVSGLWHGANLTYVFWGGLHGLYQVIGDILDPLRAKLRQIFKSDLDSFGYKLGQILGTYILTVFAWIFFRASSLSHAFSYIGRLFTHMDPWVIYDNTIFTLGLDYTEMHILAFSILMLIIASLIKYMKGYRLDEFVCKQGPIFQAISFYLLVMVIVIYGKYGASDLLKAFLYFQF